MTRLLTSNLFLSHSPSYFLFFFAIHPFILINFHKQRSINSNQQQRQHQQQQPKKKIRNINKAAAAAAAAAATAGRIIPPQS